MLRWRFSPWESSRGSSRGVYGSPTSMSRPQRSCLVTTTVAFVFWLFAVGGFFVVAPNEAKVLQLFGSYADTAKETGLRWANPLFKKSKISLRVRNFESGQLKVNDRDGNPIEIAAVVSNLLVVLCSDKATQPIVNTGTIHQ